MDRGTPVSFRARVETEGDDDLTPSWAAVPSDCSFADLVDLIWGRLLLVPKESKWELEEAVEGPALSFGVYLSPLPT